MKKNTWVFLIGQNIVMSFLQTTITIKLKMREKEGEGVNIGNNLLKYINNCFNRNITYNQSIIQLYLHFIKIPFV